MREKYNLYRKIFITIIFIMYIILLLFVIVLKFPTDMIRGVINAWLDGGDVNRLPLQLIPFKTIIFYVSHVQTIYDWFFKNLACNVIMFAPYGFLVPLISKKINIGRKVILSGCIFSVLIEIFQYITALGLCDIDDVILNTLGVLLGFGIYKIAKNVLVKFKRSKV